MTALAEQAGLSQQMISYVEREMRNPTLDTLLRITNVLEMDLGQILNQAKAAVIRKKSTRGGSSG